MDNHNHIGRHSRDERDDGVVERRSSAYRLGFGREGLDFEPLEFADPVPVGAQILEAAAIRSPGDWALVVLLPGGDMEELRPTEPLDLAKRGVEKVVAFRTDRLFRATLLERQLLWGRRTITGAELHALADLRPDEALYLDVPGGTDRLIEPSGEVDLDAPGVERIIAGPKPVTGFEVTVIYNGLVQRVRAAPKTTVAALIADARPLFGNPGGDLVLINEVGQQLAPERTLAEQGVHAHSLLQLRPPVVQGG